MSPRPRCARCRRTASKANPILPGLFVYLRLAVPLPLCLGCVTELRPQEQLADPEALHDAA